LTRRPGSFPLLPRRGPVRPSGTVVSATAGDRSGRAGPTLDPDGLGALPSGTGVATSGNRVTESVGPAGALVRRVAECSSS